MSGRSAERPIRMVRHQMMTGMRTYHRVLEVFSIANYQGTENSNLKIVI